MDLAAGMKAFDLVRSLGASLNADQSATLDAIPHQIALLMKSRVTDQESVATAVAVLEGKDTFQNKLLNLLASNSWQQVVNTFLPKSGHVHDPHAPEAVFVPLLETLQRGGLCVECGAAQSVGALVGLDPEDGSKARHPFA